MAGKLLNRLQRLVEECESGGCGPDKDDERKLPNNAPNPKPTLPATGDNLEADAESAGGGTATGGGDDEWLDPPQAGPSGDGLK